VLWVDLTAIPQVATYLHRYTRVDDIPSYNRHTQHVWFYFAQ